MNWISDFVDLSGLDKLALIQQFGSLDGIYKNLDDPSIKAGTRKKLEEGRESAYLSLELATICLEAPIEITDEKMLLKPYDTGTLTSLLDRYSLQSFLRSLDLEKGLDHVEAAPAVPAEDKDYVYIRENGLFFLMDGGKMIAYTDRAVEIGDYMPWLLDDTVEKTTFKPKELYKEILKTQKDIKPFYDIEVAQYVIDPSLSEYTVCGIAKSLVDKNLTEGDTAAAVSVLSGLRDAQEKIIAEREQKSLLFDIEFPLTVVLADMENCGFCVDKDALIKYSEKLEKNIEALEKNIYFLAGEEFNINSPKQLGVVLFEILGLPHGKKTKTGYSTSAEVLQKLAGEHEIVDSILEYRQYVKLKSTYCDGLLGLIDENGRLDLQKADLIAYSHGEYFRLGQKLGTFGYSVRKKKKKRKNSSKYTRFRMRLSQKLKTRFFQVWRRLHPPFLSARMLLLLQIGSTDVAVPLRTLL